MTEALHEISVNACKETDGKITLTVSKESYVKIAAALEKQIPKKPRAFYLGGDPFSYRCSACDMTIKAGDTFCKWCGQAQEWKEPKK